MLNRKVLIELLLKENDIEGAIKRFGDDEKLYLSVLEKFLDDDTINRLDASITDRLWDEAFTAAHALKGLAGNLGFVPLFHSVGELVMYVRAGKIADVSESLYKVKQEYKSVVLIIKKNKEDK